MPRPVITAVASIVLLLAALAVAPLASAASFQAGGDQRLEAGRTVDSALFMAGERLEIAGTVNGDVFCAGNSVVVSGTVNGDVICAAQRIEVSGTVRGDARLAGSEVTVSGAVERGVTAAADNFSLKKAGRAADLQAAASEVYVEGSLGRDLSVNARSLDITGTVGRDAQAEVTSLYLGPGSVVRGSLVYRSANDANRAENVTVGSIRREHPEGGRAPFSLNGLLAGATVFIALNMLVATVLLTAVAPRFLHGVSAYGRQKPGWAVLWGFTGLLAGLVVPMALTYSLVGLGFGWTVLAAWVLALLLALPATAFLLGRLLARNTNNVLYQALAGGGALAVLLLVPALNLLVLLAGLVFGTGMLAGSLLRYLPRGGYRLEPDKPYAGSLPPAGGPPPLAGSDGPDGRAGGDKRDPRTPPAIGRPPRKKNKETES